MQSENKIQYLNELLNRFEGLLNRFESGSAKGDQELLNQYEKALKDAVHVLDATRQTFKSKQLKELRERIEVVLQK